MQEATWMKECSWLKDLQAERGEKLEGRWRTLPHKVPSSINYVYEHQPKSPTFWNSYARTLIPDTIMTLSGTIGVTQKTMTFDTHVWLILLHTLNPQERWGTHKKRWPCQPRPFTGVVGLVRCSYIHIHTYVMNSLIHKIYMSCLIAYVYVRHTCCKSPGLQSVSCLSNLLETMDLRNSWLSLWVFPQKVGIPQNGWFIMEIPINMDDLGVPLFSETPIYSVYFLKYVFLRCNECLLNCCSLK